MGTAPASWGGSASPGREADTPARRTRGRTRKTRTPSRACSPWCLRTRHPPACACIVRCRSSSWTNRRGTVSDTSRPCARFGRRTRKSRSCPGRRRCTKWMCIWRRRSRTAGSTGGSTLRLCPRGTNTPARPSPGWSRTPESRPRTASTAGRTGAPRSPLRRRTWWARRLLTLPTHRSTLRTPKTLKWGCDPTRTPRSFRGKKTHPLSCRQTSTTGTSLRTRRRRNPGRTRTRFRRRRPRKRRSRGKCLNAKSQRSR
mmetsp:Transcript_12706/g.54388  ORF Transcript_12706/g.54388 Transcript_12706/m.54388 type:complete len:257 (-) Transcript_12706:7703-8473(-)